MDPVDGLLQWALAQGVALNGITPQRLPGRGYGLVATRHLEAGSAPVPRAPFFLLGC